MKRWKTTGDDQERQRHQASTDWQGKRVKAWIFWLCNNEPLQRPPPHLPCCRRMRRESEYSFFIRFRSPVSHTFLCRSPSIFCLQAGESERNCPASAWKLGFNLRTKWQIWRACVFVKVGEIRTSMRTAANRGFQKKKHFRNAESPIERIPLYRLGGRGEKEKMKTWPSVRLTDKGWEEDNDLT